MSKVKKLSIFVALVMVFTSMSHAMSVPLEQVGSMTVEVDSFDVSNGKVDCKINVNVGAYNESMEIHGEFYNSVVTPNRKIVSIQASENRIVPTAMSFDDQNLKLYLYDKKTGNLEGIEVPLDNSRRRMTHQTLSANSPRAVEAEELYRMEYGWMRYATPDIKVEPVDDKHNMLKERLSSSGDWMQTYTLQATYRDPLSTKPVELTIVYELGITTFRNGEVGYMSSSLEIVDEYQVDNGRTTTFKMLSMKDITCDMGMKERSFNSGYIYSASAPFEGEYLVDADISISFGVSAYGASLNYTPPFIRRAGRSDIPMRYGEKSQIKRIKANTPAQLRNNGVDLVNFKLEYRLENKNTYTVYGSSVVSYNAYLFESTRLGSSPVHERTWRIN
ncbi:hypothetical protein ACR6HW_13085 [Fusibacter sp. JL298sf-3]